MNVLEGEQLLSRIASRCPVDEDISGDGADAVLKSLRQIIHAIDVQSSKLAKTAGLTAPQLIVMHAINQLGEVTTRAIADHVSLSAPTVTTLIDRLEKAGLVERYRSAIDRRIVHSKLTRTGKAKLKSAPPLLQNSFVDAYQQLTQRRRQQIVSALKDVAQMMEADNFDASPILTIKAPETTRSPS